MAADERGGALVRGVVAVVVVGMALGVGSNAMQRAGGPRRGVAWIKQEVKLTSLEALAHAADAAPADSNAAAASDTVRADSAAHAASGATASRDTTHAKRGGKPDHAAAAAKSPAAPTSPAAPAPVATGTPAPKPDVPTVPDSREPLEAQYATIKKFWDAGAAQFVDARSPEEYAEAHIPGAVNMPFDDVFKDPGLAKKLDTHGRDVVITYCGGGDCDLSRNLAFALIETGRRKVLIFMGGMPGWKEAGNAVATGTTPGNAPGAGK